MGVLTRSQISNRILHDGLISNPRLLGTTVPKVEGASYDLCVGTIIWKDSKTNTVRRKDFDSAKDYSSQDIETLQPGQMMFVITREEIKMPLDLSATVYSRNKLSRDGILALNAGHIDPGFEGPIIIRLINLRAIPYTLKLGSAIYTIVFQKLDQPLDPSLAHTKISRDKTILNATNSADEALSNTLYDLALLTAFIKKDEFGPLFSNWLTGHIFRVLGWIIAGVVFIATVASGIQPLLDLLKKLLKNE